MLDEKLIKVENKDHKKFKVLSAVKGKQMKEQFSELMTFVSTNSEFLTPKEQEILNKI